MLIEFSATNFKSIADKITLSTVASSSAVKFSNLTHKTRNSLAPDLLATTVMVGANASGKTSIITAVEFLRFMVLNSAKNSTQGESIIFPNNKIAHNFQEKPTELEIIFSHENEVFQYGFNFNHERVLEEWLFARQSLPGSKTRTIFSRAYVNETGKYKWYINEGQVPGEKEIWKSATRDNSLFLSTAVQFNSKSLLKPFEWIQKYLCIVSSTTRLNSRMTAQSLLNEGQRLRIEDLFTSLDLKISKFRVEESDFKISEDISKVIPKDIINKIYADINDAKVYKVFSAHKNELGETVELSLDEESEGTQAIFGMAAPIVDVLDNGYTLFIDELNNSLHPLALKALISIFHDPNQNKNGAQLIFSSHDSSILKNEIMHKDQIWFVNRDDGISTKLTPLSSFKVREEVFQKSYLGGKFGALPNIRSLNFGK